MPNEMNHQDFYLGAHSRSDSEIFRISARLFSTPADVDFWQAVYRADHERWGHRVYVLTIPKSGATDLSKATEIVKGRALEQLKELLALVPERASHTTTYVHDGWFLV